MPTVHSTLNRYGEFYNLREEPPFQDEAWVQRLWFEQVYTQNLITLTGETVQILQPGFWNRSAGPDFQRACLINGLGQREVGAVEIHSEAQAWNQHGHERDPHYDEVILHVVWKAGPKLFFAGDSKRRSVRTIELSSQLKFPLLELRRHFTSTEMERKVGARIGLCQKELAQLTLTQTAQLLQDAGWHRFQKKSELWGLRSKAIGFDQALWLGLADALGYSKNRPAFQNLAQRLPIAQLLKEKSVTKREALLFGLAGFLPQQTLPKDTLGHSWFRSLWDQWWPARSEWDELTMPPKSWVLAGVRPLNRPERRLGVLSLISDPLAWKQLQACAKSGDNKSLEKFLTTLHHPFWDTHYTLKSAASKPLQILGKDRIIRFWFNVIGPLALFNGAKGIPEQLAKIKTTEVMHPASLAAVRLLGTRKLTGLSNSLLVKEGLLQIYQDFCLQDIDQCGTCSFPDFVKNWK